MPIKRLFKETVGEALKGFGGEAGSHLASRLFPISTPSGRRLGADAAAYFDAAFPGTNPWERLGSNTPAAAQVTSRAQQRIARRQNYTQLAAVRTQADAQKYVADTNAAAQRDSAAIAAGYDMPHHMIEGYGWDPRIPSPRGNLMRADSVLKGLQARLTEHQENKLRSEFMMLNAQAARFDYDASRLAEEGDFRRMLNNVLRDNPVLQQLVAIGQVSPDQTLAWIMKGDRFKVGAAKGLAKLMQVLGTLGGAALLGKGASQIGRTSAPQPGGVLRPGGKSWGGDYYENPRQTRLIP